MVSLRESGSDRLYRDKLLQALESKVPMRAQGDSLKHLIGCAHSPLERSSFAS
jgi:hypothetical protein